MIAALAAAMMLAGASLPADTSVQSAAFEATEALQGPLNGEWRLKDRAGRTLYVFSMSDPGEAPAPMARDPAHPSVEGAWRDPGRSGSAGGSNVLDSVSLRRGAIRITFSDGRTEAVALHRVAKDRWTGTLSRAGHRLAVTMTRF